MLCASVYGLYNASQPPVVKDVKIPIRDLPIGLNGLKIVQLSDIHLGPTVGFSKLSKIVTIVNQEKADVVVLTGDLVDGSVVFLQDAAVPLKSIQSKYGNYFVTGNHEYYTGDVDNWFIALASLGFKVLHNSHVFIPEKNANGQEHICLAGTDDIQANLIGYGDHKFDLAKAVGNCSQQRPVILLAHQPKAAKIALDSSYRTDLVLSGHTHGGQMFPMVIAAYLLNPFFAGLYKYGPNGSFVYVSQGTQYWGIPMRIATTMEITRITLQSAN
ncbi:transmembrane protein with metallophosphoesterase domain [Biomphalaria pfeifferi]|uniref:Transmembrane protein with metallophosphoesterase domain n=1 Tax=Biomphalaria pfeifferi TaxID=112525 RepID=A0AAD8FEC2_BIOPF|nr:transmembrane protein with metallophosphoesterase domain [Biomphalaria pfeifferi]